MTPPFLFDVDDLSLEEITSLFEEARAFKEVMARPIRKVPTLRGKSILLFFEEPSTRTRLSFEVAAKILSADVTTITKSASSLEKGESWQDTFATLARLPFDLLVIRHREEGMAKLAFQQFRRAVINAGDGCHAHPTQALLDAFTLWEKKGEVEKLTVTFLGDIEHSRVARSGLKLFQMLKAKTGVCAPPFFLPSSFKEIFPSTLIFENLEEALTASDVLIVLRVQQEREKAFYSLREYERLYSVTEEKLKKGKKDLVIMHPGPVIQGFELKKEVMEREQTLILDQVENGVAIRMALLYRFLTGASQMPTALSSQELRLKKATP